MYKYRYMVICICYKTHLHTLHILYITTWIKTCLYKHIYVCTIPKIKKKHGILCLFYAIICQEAAILLAPVCIFEIDKNLDTFLDIIEPHN